jgi:gamma-glutamylcyclotransferase (GGCT)/AIG2-like uncharacterized protein YtfP
MCWIAHLKPNQILKQEYLERAATINKDGYGVMYYKDNNVESFKTMDFDVFKEKINTLEPYERVIHLRYTSIGKTTHDNSHPFPVGNDAWMCHNGSMSSMRTVACTTTCNDNSDTRNLAEIISLCKYDKISDILPLIHQITGKTGNKLVFMEKDGEVTIVNKDLGNEEDGIWYSNTYHVEKETPTYNITYPMASYHFNKNSRPTKVFVYGTLKANGRNHELLRTSKLLGTGVTAGNYAMIGKDMPFPYLLSSMSPDEGGLQILGEVYECNEATMELLDSLEGVPYHYIKKQISVLVDSKYEIVTTYMKTNVTSLDLSKPFINEFPVSKKTENTSQPVKLKPQTELEDLDLVDLCDYLDYLEYLYYSRSFNSHKHYTATRDEVLEELELMYDILDDMEEDDMLSNGQYYFDN